MLLEFGKATKSIFTWPLQASMNPVHWLAQGSSLQELQNHEYSGCEAKMTSPTERQNKLSQTWHGAMWLPGIQEHGWSSDIGHILKASERTLGHTPATAGHSPVTCGNPYG